ncbi:MAG: hypothetical protein CMI54_08730 [Parcubacteria group bacterium]|nr:hypothetical protein [Parcubacteria group bacterium]|tara:strand:+ start:2599 stop:2778 length:180 start_codon:yes stop_codon:yes gene_type:complete
MKVLNQALLWNTGLAFAVAIFMSPQYGTAYLAGSLMLFFVHLHLSSSHKKAKGRRNANF